MPKLIQATLLVLLAAGLARAEVAINACDASVPDEDIGVLQSDIVCLAETQTGVVVGIGATLQLNGHTITGGRTGVVCTECTIEGPGEIFGFSGAGISSTTNPRPKISVRGDVAVHDNLEYGIVMTYHGKLTLSDVTITGNNRGGIGIGVTSSTDKGNVKGSNVTITGNDGPGLKSKRIKLTGATIQANDGTGILSGSGMPVLTDSIVTGNSTDFPMPYDIKSYKRPKLKDSTCGLSVQVLADASLGESWGVCAND